MYDSVCMPNSSTNKFHTFIKATGLIWITSVALFILTTAINYAVVTKKIILPFFSSYATSLFLLEIGIGSLSFVILILSLIFLLFLNNEVLTVKKRTPFTHIGIGIKYIGILAALPVYLIFTSFKHNKSVTDLDSVEKPFFKKSMRHRVFGILLICLTLLPVWLAVYGLIGFIAFKQLGYVQDQISISGTGSMYPTFPKGEGEDPKELAKQIVSTSGMLPYPNGLFINGTRIFGHQLGRGDIVVLSNNKTQELSKKLYGEGGGWVKRIVALAGDTLELRDGVVYINNTPQKEPYIARARSTFGEEFLTECKKITVPAQSVFVMGDNRKGSGDSREIGPISVNDIHHVLPLASQKGTLDKNWRNPDGDLAITSRIHLDKNRYVTLLNEKRKAVNAKPLTYEPKLETSSNKRGEIILKYDDFSFEATRSGYSMYKAMTDANYYNIAYGESKQLGYFEADELIENQFEFPDTKDFLLDRDYEDIGIAEVDGTLNGCPTHIIVIHFAGYVPPNYTKDLIDSWKTPLAQLRDVQPSWQKVKTYQQFYDSHKAEVDRLNDIISQRITAIAAIVQRMEANQWLTNEQNTYTKTGDKTLYEEQNSLATKLNSY